MSTAGESAGGNNQSKTPLRNPPVTTEPEDDPDTYLDILSTLTGIRPFSQSVASIEFSGIKATREWGEPHRSVSIHACIGSLRQTYKNPY